MTVETSADAGDPPAGGPSPSPDRGRRWERLLLSREIAAATSALDGRPSPRVARARRAIAARDRAESLLQRAASAGSGRGDDDDVLSLTALQQAAHWSVLALDDDLPDDCAPRAAADALVDRVAGTLSLSERHTAQLAELVGERTFVELAALPGLERRQAADALREFVDRAAAQLLAPERALSRLHLRRWSRVLAASLALAAAATGIAWGVRAATRPPDLAATSRWKASSTYGGWDQAARKVDGASSIIFFHTNHEPSPWVQFDLGDGASFSSVEVANRRDCCSDRASFLVVEVSPDGARWTEIATRSGDFTTWTARFPRQQARYVRVRSLKQTWLHFERVSVR